MCCVFLLFSPPFCLCVLFNILFILLLITTCLHFQNCVGSLQLSFSFFVSFSLSLSLFFLCIYLYYMNAWYIAFSFFFFFFFFCNVQSKWNQKIRYTTQLNNTAASNNNGVSTHCYDLSATISFIYTVCYVFSSSFLLITNLIECECFEVFESRRWWTERKLQTFYIIYIYLQLRAIAYTLHIYIII